MYKTILSITMLMLCGTSVLNAQNTKNQDPKGKMISRAFFDLSTNAKNHQGVNFGITRAFIGYKYNISPYLETQIIADLAASKSKTTLRLEPYIRNAYIKYHTQKYSVGGGLINMKQFSFNEKYWGHRYVNKVIQDEYSFGPSVDLALVGTYNFNKQFSGDLTISNGFGYKNIKNSKSLKYAVGLTYQPIQYLAFRVYADFLNHSHLNDGTKGKNQYTMSIGAGYKNGHVLAGTEYSYQNNHKMIANDKLQGYSAYLTYYINKKWDIYGKFDLFSQQKGEKKAKVKENQQNYLFGVEFLPCKQLKLSTNFRLSNKSQDFIHNDVVSVNAEFNI